MSEIEKRIAQALCEAIAALSEDEKQYFIEYAEKMARQSKDARRKIGE